MLKLLEEADNYCGDMSLDRCCKQRNPSSHSPVLSRFKPYWRQRNNNQKPQPYASRIKMVCKTPNLFMGMVRHHGSCHIWCLASHSLWRLGVFHWGCLLDSNLQIQQSKTWLSNCLPALLSLNNQAGRIVIIALWCPAGCLFNLPHDKFT